ncbi:MAG: UTP--glucose-1-phosphate uridylyltransferase [Campylobacterota bacterium]|nr:UTP--glucose-1-phosphate uridylyltransferase [Campylobacterota bacterium]
MSEIRYDRFHDTHVIIAPERLNRPDCNIKVDVEEIIKDENCPFCEGNEFMTPPEIFAIRKKKSFENEIGWQCRVVPNLYKSAQIEAPYAHHKENFEYWDGFGAHEIIIDTPKHHTSMTQWSKQDIQNWLITQRVRVNDLQGDGRIAYISLFKNEGKNAGATQKHSHTQLIGLPIVPRDEKSIYQNMQEYFSHHSHALLESIILQEESEEKRIVSQSENFTAYCPYASAYPFEVLIGLKEDFGTINNLSDESIKELSPLLLLILKKLKVQLGCFDFNLSIAIPPLQDNFNSSAYRFSLRIMPRIYQFGGFELSSGMMINPVSPELAAKLLRESLV